MKKEYLIGRTEECKRLNRCLKEDSAQLVIVYGRRWVGKTYLIDEFFDYSFAFKLTGSFNQSKAAQLENFEKAYPEAFKANVKMPPAGHYGDAEKEMGIHSRRIQILF